MVDKEKFSEFFSVEVQSLSELIEHFHANYSNYLFEIYNLFASTASVQGTIYIIGNGGSSAGATHFASELVGIRLPKGLRAVNLSAESASLTAISNDYSYDEVFAHQIRCFGRANDLLLALSTSGNSPNVIKGVQAASALKMRTCALLGRDGGQLAGMADRQVIIRSNDTQRIQEAHQFLLHTLYKLLIVR